MATRQKRKSKAPARRAKRSLLASRPAAPWIAMEPHQVDIVGLALIAIGLFLAGVAYLHWAGGTLGDGAIHGLKFVLGALGYAVPAALVAGGGLILARDLRPPERPMRTGLVCLVVSLTLALAAGTLGIGPGAYGKPRFLARRGVRDPGRGARSGRAVAHSEAVLDTGRAHSRALRIAGRADPGQRGHACGRDPRHGRGCRRHRASAAPLDRGLDCGAPPGDRRGQGGGHTSSAFAHEQLLPPEPDTAELVVRSTHVEAPPIEDGGYGTEADDELEPLEDGADSQPPLPGEEPAIVEVAPEDLTPQGRYRASITDDPNFNWRVPSPRALTRSTGEAARPDTAGQEQVAKTLLETLGHFGIEAKVVGRVTGPHITRYEMRLAPGIKVSKVAQLKDDLAYALAATDIRILAPIPGKQAVGVEVPNARRRIVHLGDVFQAPPPDWSPLTVWLGKDIAGRAIGADLAKMPHLLVAGTTGAGKSACVNAMLSSILLRATPHEVRLVLVDPKQVELNHYDSIPHLLTPVITSPRMAANALQNLVKEMEQRYSIMSLARTRSLPELNRAREKRGEPPLPYILCVIDELADLMMVAPADVEDSIIRLAQKARAVGIHLVLATQSPRVDVITGMIKANVPSRIAFSVSSQTDSRVILDAGGAESLLGQGDMLFSPVGSSRLQRIQGAYIDEEQILEADRGLA